MNSNRTALVTGGSSGIGLETARGLIAAGYQRVGIVGRNTERLDQACRSLGRSAVAFRADFSSLAEVRNLARRVESEFDALHVLVNNAGVWHAERQLSRDGIEDTFAVNHLAPFVLTNALLPLLRASAPARIVHLSSRRHVHCAGIKWHDLGLEQGYTGLRAYDQSKLANILFSNALANRLSGSEITSNAVHPGSVATNITRDSGLLTTLQNAVGKLILSTPSEGAATSIHVATHPEGARLSGAYFARSKPKAPSKAAQDWRAAERLWLVSEEMTRA